MAPSRFAPGNAGGPGRPKGAPNKANALLKDDILQAYGERGGIEWVRGLSDKDFVQLLRQIMPREIAADVKMRLDAQLDLAGVPDDELARLADSIGIGADSQWLQAAPLAELQSWADSFAQEIASRKALPAQAGG